MQPILTLLVSNLLGAAVGGVFFLSAGWRFDLAEMGLYAVAISTHWIIAGLIGTGLNVATVRLTTDYLTRGDRTTAAGMVALAVMTSASISLLAVGLFLGLALLAEQLFLPGELLILVVLWAGARSVLHCLRAGLLAQQQYIRAGLLTCLSALTGLVSLAAVVLGGPLTLSRLLLAHFLGLGASAVGGIGFLLPLLRSGIRIPKKLLRDLLAYARWPALSGGLRSFQINLGPLVLVALAGSAEAGLYILGRYPAFVFSVVAVSFYEYWLPAAAQEEKHGQLVRFLRRQMLLAGLVGAGMTLTAVAFQPLLHRLGSNFAVAAPLFVLNALDFAVGVLIRPVEAAYHGLHKPHLELLLRVAHLPLLLGLALLLAPNFGAVGMVWAQVFSNLLGLVLAVWLFWRALDRETRHQISNSPLRDKE